MITTVLLALIAFVAAAVVTDTTCPLVERAALLVRAVDYPGARKHQKRAIPRLGGVAIAAGAGFAAGGVALARWLQLSAVISRREIIGLALGTLLVFLAGLVDDVLGVSSMKKFAVEVLAAILLVHVGWNFQVLNLPGGASLQLGLLGPVVTVLWIVGVTNAVNLLDGLDGLAAGVVAIIAASMLGYALLLGNDGTVVLMAAVTGAAVGFLRHNWAPARIFMGDSGSLTLGFLLGAMSVHSSLKAPAAIALLVPVLALGVPVIDTLLVMVVRFLGRSHSAFGDRILAMFRADRQHLHHLLLHHGRSRQRVVTWIYGIVLTFCALALVVALTRNPMLGVVVLVIEGIVMLAMRQRWLRDRIAQLSRERRDALRSELETQWKADEAEVVAFPDHIRHSDLR
jgi:UDP-GlcNAc:undecaprenyl-phosphate GlcNAc-1-phosphate transferase